MVPSTNSARERMRCSSAGERVAWRGMVGVGCGV
jgi:hypothetical protein